jgi:hypothetical protein
MFCHDNVIVLIRHSRSYTRSNHPLLGLCIIRCRRPRDSSPHFVPARAPGGAALALVGFGWPSADHVGGSKNGTGRDAARARNDRKAPRCIVANPEAHTPYAQQWPYHSCGYSEPHQFPRTGARDLSKLIRAPAFSQYMESPSRNRPRSDVSPAVESVYSERRNPSAKAPRRYPRSSYTTETGQPGRIAPVPGLGMWAARLQCLTLTCHRP